MLALSFACSIAAAQAMPAFLNNGVTAHRGASAEFPENTMPAFERALALGVDWIELDIHRTQDGQVVVIHDGTTESVGDRNVTVSEVPYEVLKTVDVAHLFRLRKGLTREQCPPAAVPRLRDVLELIIRQNRTRVSIQPKTDIVDDAVAVVKELKAENWVGFNDADVRKMAEGKRFIPGATIFWDRGEQIDLAQTIEVARTEGFPWVVLHQNAATPENVSALKDAGLQVGAWTVNAPDDMRKMLDAGVQRLYTDDPKTLLNILAERAPRR